MCGIVAMISTNEQLAAGHLEAMRTCIRHRGPDGGGTVLRQADRFTAGLGAQRLSILDLSPAGMMPMANEDERVWIVYNGEIYNHGALRSELEQRGHRYRSRTDTETVIHAYEEYGPDCFARFNGMFACVIYDQPQQRVVLARDRIGVKPLYYSQQPGGLLCASELKAMLYTGLVPAVIDPVALDIYLALGYVPAPYTLIKGVFKLCAGTYAIYDGERLCCERYWDPTEQASQAPFGTWDEMVAATRVAVGGAIHRQMMSDVPVGVMLSGGLDSTIVAALAQQLSSEPLHTFSIGFTTQQSRLEQVYNQDRHYARLVATTLGTQHHEVIARDTGDLESLLRRLVAQLDEPVWEPSFLSIYLISVCAREHGVKVLLSGDGSDELFGGYPWHPALNRLEQFEQIPGLRPLLGLLARMPLPTTTNTKVRDLYRKYRQSAVAKYHAQYDIFDITTRAQLFARAPEDDPLDSLIEPLLTGATKTLASRFALAELMLWVGEHFNQRLDRMTMAASVEGRVPFQDNAVVDLALALPAAARWRDGMSKASLRAAFADLVPAAVMQRPKRPFAAPATAWMQGSLAAAVRAAIVPDSLARLPGMDTTAVAPLWKRFCAGLPVRQEQIWSLFHLVLWAEELLWNAPASSTAPTELRQAVRGD